MGLSVAQCGNIKPVPRPREIELTENNVVLRDHVGIQPCTKR